jgi:DNA-binding FadR family transcriptional regulator
MAAGLKGVLKAGKTHQEIEDEEEEEVDIYDAQQGHTTVVAKRFYAITTESIGQLNSAILKSYFDASMQWHKAIFQQSNNSNSVMQIGTLHSAKTSNEYEDLKKELEAMHAKFHAQLVETLKEARETHKQTSTKKHSKQVIFFFFLL